MLASNGFSIMLVVWSAWTFDGHGMNAPWWLAATIGTGISVMRQQEWNARLWTDEVGARFKKA